MSLPLRSGRRPEAAPPAPQPPRPIRVLHVITHLGRGGATDNTLLTVAGLDRSRYRVDLAAGPGALEERAGAAADRLVVLPSLRRDLIALADLRAAIALWRLVRDYDVVHTHTAKAGVLGRLAARARGVPAVVHTIHAFPVNDYMQPLQRRVLLAVERLASRWTDRIIAVCEANATEALSLRMVVSGVAIEPARNGSGETRNALGIPAAAPVVGTVTRLMEQKAPLDFLAAARRVLVSFPDAHLLIVGDGPMYGEVQTAIGGDPRIHLLGFRDDVPELLAAMDVVAFSSLWEGLGRALTEAVLAGKPVVATAVNGVPDLVVDAATGYLTPPGRPDLLAARIVDVLGRPDRGGSMGVAGAARVAGRFGVGDMLAGVDAVYQQVLGERSRRRSVTPT
jgi:glycosyltransferase involved in cell wall biosynthesis